MTPAGKLAVFHSMITRTGLAALGCCLFLLTAAASDAGGQVIRGRLVSGGNGQGVPNALVVLEDSGGDELARTITLASGTFSFRLTTGGQYRLRVMRIGYAPWRSSPIQLSSGATYNRTIELPVERVLLPDDIVVEGSGACSGDQSVGAVTAALMEEAQKAFALTETTLKSRRVMFHTTEYLRRTSPEGVVLEESNSAIQPLTAWPIESAPIDTLARWGFVRKPTNLQRAAGLGPTYYGPDGAVLFSAWFLKRHCYSITRDPRAPRHVGLQFTPAEDTGNPDVAGTLWLDERTLALDRLEFHYVDLPGWIPESSAAGRLQFEEMPGGGWLIRRWWLRAPIQSHEGNKPHVGGYQEIGGTVVGEGYR